MKLKQPDIHELLAAAQARSKNPEAFCPPADARPDLFVRADGKSLARISTLHLPMKQHGSFHVALVAVFMAPGRFPLMGDLTDAVFLN